MRIAIAGGGLGGLTLARILPRHGIDAPAGRCGPAAAIRTYEQAMFTRIRPIAEMSARVQSMMLSPTAAEDIVRFFTPRPSEPTLAD